MEIYNVPNIKQFKNEISLLARNNYGDYTNIEEAWQKISQAISDTVFSFQREIFEKHKDTLEEIAREMMDA